ncbi:MAG: caspase family protein [Elusimicrobiota bacterium]|nr:caspase family protein [Elusimicrobiota bacterium]
MRRLLPIAVVVLSGCIATLPAVTTPEPAALEAAKNASAEARAGQAPLRFAVFYVSNPGRFGERVAAALRARGVDATAVVDEGLASGYDVLLRLTYSNKPTGVVTVASTTATRRKLITIQDPFWTLNSFDDNLSRTLKAAFEPGSDLYAVARGEKPAATAASPAAPAALGSEQIAAIVKATLESAKAASPAPAKPAAEPVSDADKPRYKLAARPDDFAVVIGIDGYSDLPSAPYAERDASAVKSHLLALGYPERNIALLLGAKAGRASVAKLLETWLAKNANERSTVFVYYSGHGAPDPETGDAYLVPWDGDPQFLKDTAYPIKRLYAKLSDLKVKRAIVALDACFSGSGGRSVLAKGLRPLVAKVSLAQDSAKVVALTAADGGQVTGALDEQGHGLFTYYFLKGLNGAAKGAGDRPTLRALHQYLTPLVQDGARRQNRDQTPQLYPPQSPLADLAL